MADDKKLTDEQVKDVTGGGDAYSFKPKDLSEPVSLIRDEIENVTPKFSMCAGANGAPMPTQDNAEPRHPRK